MNDATPHGRAGVDPEVLFGISLLIGLALSWGALDGAMHGRVDILAAGVRLLVAVAFAWAGCFGVATMVTGFARDVAARDAAVEARQRAERRAQLALEAAETTADEAV
jgi:hypothetical protein